MKSIGFDKGEPISHAYILADPSLSGRREAARALAAAMVCEGTGSRPCGVCRHCRKALADVHPDVIYIERELNDKGRLKREVGIDQIRYVVGDAAVMPNEANVKVYIIAEADTMNVPAQNAMLKLLEEPPLSAAFILGVPSAELLLPTVRSRCVTVSLAGEGEGDDEAVRQAIALFAAIETGSRAALLRWSVAAESMDIRQAEAFVAAARERIADALTGRSGAMDKRTALELDTLLGRCGEYLRLNTGVKHILGLIAADGITEDRNAI